MYIDDGKGTHDLACVKCIKTLPLRWIYPKEDERKITSLINARYPKGKKSQDQRFALTVEMCDEYRRTPRLPNFVQDVDWPHCCGDFTEYVGDAGKFYQGPFDGFDWWGYEEDFAIENGIEGMMDSESGVSLFRCLDCTNKFWTCQYT
ncbi:MAG: hypothetical protein QF473_01485 [Planctomycetota bacterium]|nr:hypothetical protein [Planctomycetota bacterium]